MSDWPHEIDIASNLAREAGRRIMTIYDQDFTISYKGTNDPLTEADQEANTIIVEGLAAHFPQDTIIAEESSLPLEVQTTARVWQVDPLDGTKEFISHNDEFSIHDWVNTQCSYTARCGLLANP